MEKRKLTLSLKRKIDLIHAVEKNPEKKRKETAYEFGIKPSTLSGILRGKEKYKFQYYSGQTDVQKMRARPPKQEAVDIALLHWFAFARSNNIPVNGSVMKSKAEELSRHLGIVGWRCSEGWLHRFKKRHNISYKAMCDERLSAIEQSRHTQWLKDVLKPTLIRYDPKNVFCADETALFWRLLPDKTTAFKSEQCYDGKKSKERLTLLVCANMDGTEKMPLLTIGKFDNPRCFRGIHKLPVKYVASSKAWMTSELFSDWLWSFDDAMDCQHRKVLLVINSCPAHPNAKTHLKATELLFLPPTAATKLQPCSQGIIQNLKVHYRTMTLLRLVQHIDAGGAAEDLEITLLDAVSMLKSAWEKVAPTTITNCFTRAHFRDDDYSVSGTSPHQHDDDVPFESLAQGPLLVRLYKDWKISASDYFNIDSGIPSTAHENVALFTVPLSSTASTSASGSQDSVSDSDNDDCGEPEQTVTDRQVLDCVHKISLYLVQAGCSDAVLVPFSDFRQALENHMVSTNKTQPAATQFFRREQHPEKAGVAAVQGGQGVETGHTERGQTEEGQRQEGLVGEVQGTEEQGEKWQRREGQRESERQAEEWCVEQVQIKEERLENGLSQGGHVEEKVHAQVKEERAEGGWQQDRWVEGVPIKQEQGEEGLVEQWHAVQVQVNGELEKEGQRREEEQREEDGLGLEEWRLQEVQIKQEQKEEGQMEVVNEAQRREEQREEGRMVYEWHVGGVHIRVEQRVEEQRREGQRPEGR